MNETTHTYTSVVVTVFVQTSYIYLLANPCFTKTLWLFVKYMYYHSNHNHKTCSKCTYLFPFSLVSQIGRYVQDWMLMRFQFLMVSITVVLIGKKTPKHKQFCQIWSNMRMSNNPTKCKLLIGQYSRSILDISGIRCTLTFHIHFYFCSCVLVLM